MKREIRIQICMPEERIYFDTVLLDRVENHRIFTKYTREQLDSAPRAIRRIANSDDPRATKTYDLLLQSVIRSGVLAAFGGSAPIRDSTASGQPVYEPPNRYRLQERVAIQVSVRSAAGGPMKAPGFWLELPERLPRDTFTGWFPPVHEDFEDQRPGLWWRLAHGGALPTSAVRQTAPRMRASLVQPGGKHDDPKTDYLPALTTARDKFRTPTSDSQFVYEFVPAKTEIVPVCD